VSGGAAVQLDLFGEVEAAETVAAQADRSRLRGALEVLAFSCPDTLEVLIHLGYWRDRDDRSVGYSAPWAYSVTRKGLRFEHETTWGGWSSRPRHLVTWEELQGLVGLDPRRRELIDWAAGLWRPGPEDRMPFPDEVPWRYLIRPYELWPNADHWHSSYVVSDHAMPGWDRRWRAWKVAGAILGDAIGRVGQ